MSNIEKIGDTARKARIVSTVEGVAARVIKQHAIKLRELTEHVPVMTAKDIATALIPEECTKQIGIATNAITLATKLILDPDAQLKLIQRNKKEGIERSLATCENVRWEIEEIDALKILLKKLVHPPGHGYAGSPMYEDIARVLNKKFHGQNEVRTASSCRAFARAHKKKYQFEICSRKLVPWSEAEFDKLRELTAHPIFRHTTGSRAGDPDWKRIAEMINKKFHTSAFQKGIHIRNADLCSTRHWQLLNLP